MQRHLESCLFHFKIIEKCEIKKYLKRVEVFLLFFWSCFVSLSRKIFLKCIFFAIFYGSDELIWLTREKIYIYILYYL